MLILTRFKNQSAYFSDRKENEVIVRVLEVSKSGVKVMVDYKRYNSNVIRETYNVSLRMYEKHTVLVKNFESDAVIYKIELVGYSDDNSGVRLGFTAPRGVKILRDEKEYLDNT